MWTISSFYITHDSHFSGAFDVPKQNALQIEGRWTV
jgi:hypothetical protein